LKHAIEGQHRRFQLPLIAVMLGLWQFSFRTGMKLFEIGLHTFVSFVPAVLPSIDYEKFQ
jgi:hypothetical protein